MKLTIEEIEKQLGPREDYILINSEIPLLREWAILRGYKPFDVHRMKAVELANIYHNDTPAPSVAPDINDTIIKVLEAVNAPGFEVSLTRRIARSEMQQEILSGETTKRLIKETLEQLAPRQLIVTSPQGNVTLDGLQHYRTENVIRKCALNHPVMMVGPAGCGKTTIGQQAAKALNLPFYITSTINDTHELTGFIDGYGKYHSTPFRTAFEFGGVWLADEIDAWDASALLAANAALANGYATFPDRNAPIPRSPSFRMVATANTFGTGADRVYIGRNELDAASLDRFAFVTVDYDLNLERAFCNGNIKWLEHVWQLRKRIAEKNIRHVVSTRAIIMGSAALASGDDWKEVEESYLFKGMSETDREKVK
jgi:midasin (ATPase involved in ribosome maturation)